jgi:purine-binding chemotaxis protein CheW
MNDTGGREENLFKTDPEEKKKTLRLRARQLAQETGRKEAAGEYIEVTAFLLGQERYAIETSDICEVYPLKELTVLPCTPAFVAGVINIRGRILTIIDIKKFFSLPEKGITNLNRVIVVRRDSRELGILADEIMGIQAIPVSGLQPPPHTFTVIQGDYLKGITGEQVIVLDMDKFMSNEKIIVREEVEL